MNWPLIFIVGSLVIGIIGGYFGAKGTKKDDD